MSFIIRIQNRVTKFLALDKCLPKRKFLQVIDIEPSLPDIPKSLHLDPEWLVILKKTDQMLSVESYNQAPIPANKTIEVLESDLDEIKEDFQVKLISFVVISTKYLLNPIQRLLTFSKTSRSRSISNETHQPIRRQTRLLHQITQQNRRMNQSNQRIIMNFILTIRQRFFAK